MADRMSLKETKDSPSNSDRYSALPSADGPWVNHGGRGGEGVSRRNGSVAVLLKPESPSSGARQVVSTRTYETIPFRYQCGSSSPLRSRDMTSSPVLNRKLANRPQPNSLTSLASDLESKSHWGSEANTPTPTGTAPGHPQNGIRSGGGCTVKMPPQVRLGELTDGRIYHSNDDSPPSYHLDDARVQVMRSSPMMRSPCSNLRCDSYGLECSSFKPDKTKEEDIYSIRERCISNNVHSH